MADVPPTPARVVIPLRRDTEAPQCPEVERCLLELVREPEPKLLEVIDTGLPSPSLNRETTRQVVQAKMIPNRRSCHRDYTVRVSLFGSGGWVAVGERVTRTITVRIVRVYTFSGSVISDTIASTVESAPESAPPGTTTTTETVDNGDGTETTTTTTTVIERVVWETQLADGEPNPRPLFPNRPYNLTQVRYRHLGEDISLFHYGYSVYSAGAEPTHYLAVSVLRLDRMYTRSFQTGQSLQVHAALSEDFERLYVAVATTLDGVNYTINWERHHWSVDAGEWSLSGTGPVDISSRGEAMRAFSVDRRGRIRAALSMAVSSFADSEIESSVCNETPRDGTFVYDVRSGSSSDGRFFLWDIDAGAFVEAEGAMSHGVTIAGGDYAILDSPWAGRNYTDHEVFGGAKWETAKQHLWYSRYFQSYYGWLGGDVSAGGIVLGLVESGRKRGYNVQVDSSAENPDRMKWWVTLRITLRGYEDVGGEKTARVRGGVVFFDDLYTRYSLSGEDYASTVPGQNAVPCPPWGYNDLAVWGTPTESLEQGHRAVWPVQFSAQAVGLCGYSYDRVGTDWYALCQTGPNNDGPFSWLVWHNGGLVTAAVSRILGGIETNGFSAIYHR